MGYHYIMKLNRKAASLQRRALDQKLRSLDALKLPERPRMGWIRAVREALAMSTAQLAARLKISQGSLTDIEAREVKKTVTLETLERAARALRCRLVYVFVPEDGSLESAMEAQARKVAAEIARPITHSMRLESQGVDALETNAQIDELARELKARGDARIWGRNKK